MATQESRDTPLPTNVKCGRCKTPGLHTGGRAQCPFQTLSDLKARAAGTNAALKMQTGMSYALAVEAALAESQ